MMCNRIVLALAIVLTMFSRRVNATESCVLFIDADDVHAQGNRGAGATVVMIDSGVHYSDPGLVGGIASGGLSIINGDWFYDDGADPCPPGESHGTYMSLIITDATGVAPDALILPIRIETLQDAVQAINYATNRRQTVDPTIRVINISMGSTVYYQCSCDNDAQQNQYLATAISNAASAGIVTFAATGNESECGGICAPACVSAAVRVAADYDDDYDWVTYYWPEGGIQCGDLSDEYWVTCFSNVAEDCDWFLAAPGYDITFGSYSGHGTSQATAICSGVAALMASKAGPCGAGGWAARETIWWNAISYEWGWPYCPLPPQPRHVNTYWAVNATVAGSCSLGDMNCNGEVNSYDIDGFVLALSSYPEFEAYYAQYPWGDGMLADINEDEVVNSYDIDPFIELLGGG
ncbi:MAG: S8 family serine peptidase [Planctomycetota bacterium]